MKTYNVAIVGPMGAVGLQVADILIERRFPINTIKLLGTKINSGKEINFDNKLIYTEEAGEGAFIGVDIAFFCVDGEISKNLAPIAVNEGSIVIDNSSAWRMEKSVPLIIPEVNPEDLDSHKGLIANPNCSTVQMLVPLKPIHDKYKIKRIVVSTYQAVSGTGKNAIDELIAQANAYVSSEEITHSVYPYQILFNTLPHIDSFLDNGYTKEEIKMIDETKKILDSAIDVTATTVRVPVFRGHSEAVNIETELPMNVEDVRALLETAPGVKLLDNLDQKIYPMPLNSEGTNEVFVGRIRKDFSIPNGLNMWIVSDNLRKGAALNAVQIAETLIDRNLL